MKIKKGFTLAEVLITLGVIGIIAGITIPALISNYQDSVLKKQWKESYSILNQAMTAALNDNGGPFEGFSSKTVMKDTFKPYLKYVKDCATPTVGICWANNVKQPNGGSTSGWEDNPGLILTNGMFIRFYQNNSSLGCAQTIYYSTGECGQIQVDVNGMKGPNVTGKDVFAVHVLSNSLKPAGAGDSLRELSAANCATNGTGCGAALLLD